MISWIEAFPLSLGLGKRSTSREKFFLSYWYHAEALILEIGMEFHISFHSKVIYIPFFDVLYISNVTIVNFKHWSTKHEGTWSPSFLFYYCEVECNENLWSAPSYSIVYYDERWQGLGLHWECQKFVANSISFLWWQSSCLLLLASYLTSSAKETRPL